MHAVRSRCFAALRASARRATSATSRLSRRPHHHRANASRRARPTRRDVSSATTTRETGEDASRGGRFLTASPTEEGPDDRRRRHRAHGLPAFGDVLLLGEGDFSFSRALVESASVGVGRVTATSLESAAEIETRWGGAANVDALRRASNVEIVHGVDATALETTLPDPGRRYDKIVFMFPHIAGKGRISLNRELLDAFFQSAERALAPGGSIEVGLVKGQGGTPADEDKQRALGNTWQIQARAAGGDFVLVDAARFDAASWEALGYRSRGHWRSARRGEGEDVEEGGGVRTALKRADFARDRRRGFQHRDGVVHLFRRETELGGATCPWPVEYARDVSVFVDPNVFSDEEFARVARASAGRGVESDVTLLEEFAHDDGKTSKTFRLTFRSATRAFSDPRANAAQFNVRDAIEANAVNGATLR